MEKIECPLCESTDVEVEFDSDEGTSYVCNKCRHRWEEYD